MSKNIRWGIVSAGRIAHTFAKDIAATKLGVLQAVAARNGSDAQRFADQYEIPTAHEGYQALFQDPNVEAIYVATPHTLHLQNSAAALRAGKAVMCEKPLTINANECRQLIRIAQQNTAYLMEAMWTWFLPAMRTAKEWVDAGRIGKIVKIQGDFGYRKPYDVTDRLFDPALAGGCLLDMGVYPVALCALFIDTDPDQISAVARYAPNGVEDDLVATLDYGDKIATIGCSFRAELSNCAYIVGEQGIIKIPKFWSTKDCQLWVDERMTDQFKDDRVTNGFHYQIDAVNDDIVNGKTESAILPLSASLRFQILMDRIKECL